MTNDEQIMENAGPSHRRQGGTLNPWSYLIVRLAISVWATLLLVICVRSLLRPQTNSVYPIFATAARNFLAGADLYGGAGGVYRYSPLVAALFVPLSDFSDALGGVLWRLLNAAVYL